VRHLVLCATYPGTGQAVMPPVTELQTAGDFPGNQGSAMSAFKAAIAEYPPAPAASSGTKGIQNLAMSDWRTGSDAAGRKTASISAPTLIADGTDDQLDPLANDHTLARTIPGARLVLYPDAGHAFLFQDWSRFASLVNSFLNGNPSA
jgi:pimeloyl-ACP methyl ester carboxylesterase